MSRRPTRRLRGRREERVRRRWERVAVGGTRWVDAPRRMNFGDDSRTVTREEALSLSPRDRLLVWFVDSWGAKRFPFNDDTGVVFFAPGEVLPAMTFRHLVGLVWGEGELQAAYDAAGGPPGKPLLLDSDEIDTRAHMERRKQVFDFVTEALMVVAIPPTTEAQV